MLRIDPGSNLVTGHVFVGKTPLRIAAFEGRLWSTDFDGGTITAVSPSTLRRVATVRVGPQPEGIVAFGSYLWVVSEQSGNLVRIAPGDAHPLTHVSVGNQPRQVAADAAHLWVSVFGDNSVVEVDPSSRKVVRCVAYEAADAVTPAGSLLRVTSDNGPSTAVLNPRTGRLSHDVKLSDGFISDANSDVVSAGNGTWVSSPHEGVVYRLAGS